MKRTVVVHQQHGIFIGMMGPNGLFSLACCMGCYQATSFNGELNATDFMSGHFTIPLDEYRFVEIEAPDNYIEPEDLVAAGLEKEAAPMILVKRDFLHSTIH